MNNRLVLALVLAPLAVACGKPYVVVRAANPNPFTRPGCKLVVEDVQMDKLVVGGKTDAEYFADKKPEAQASYQEDKAAFAALFRTELMNRRGDLVGPPPASGDNTYVMRPHFVFWEPGYNIGISSRAAEATIVIDVLDPTGQNILDEIRTTAKAGGFASGSKMRATGEILAGYTARYLKDRFICAPVE